MQALADLATLQPFDANYIDFRQILAFVDRYAAGRCRSEVTQLRDQIVILVIKWYDHLIDKMPINVDIDSQ